MTVPLAGSIRKLSSKTVMVFFERTTEIGALGELDIMPPVRF